MAGGRPRILDEAKQREVCALVSAGCSLRAAARYVDCATNTIRREAVRDAAFGQRFREARLAAQLSPLRAMQRAAGTHWRAAAWMLERTDPDHFARRPPPAFRPKQARALVHDILAIVNAEIDDLVLKERIGKQLRHLMEYSIDGVVNVERHDRQLREIMRTLHEFQGDLLAGALPMNPFLARRKAKEKPPPGAAPPQPTSGRPPQPGAAKPRPTNGQPPQTEAAKSAAPEGRPV